jgi:ferredoxin
MKIAADLEICVGSGMCAMAAPEVFDQNGEDGRVLVMADQPSPDSLDVVRQAVAACPTGALSLRDE